MKIKKNNNTMVEQRKASVSKIISPDLREKESTFASVFGLIKVKKDNDSLSLNMKGMNFEMIPNIDGWFSLKLKIFKFLKLNLKSINNLRVNVLNINDEKVFALEQAVSHHEFRQVIGKEYINVSFNNNWLERLENYEIIDKKSNILSSLSLIYSDNILTIKANVRKMGKLSLILNPISDSEAIIMGYGRFANDTIYAKEENGNIVLEIFGLKLNKNI